MGLTRWKKDQQHTHRTWYKPIEDMELAEAAMCFTLSRDITSAVIPGDNRLVSMALDIGSRFKPLSPADEQQLLARTEGVEPIFSCDSQA